MAETPRFAHLVVLMLFGTALCLAVTLLALLYAALRQSALVAKAAGASAALIVSGYAVLLFGAALTTPDRTLAAGGWKYFCEMDCHIAYSVEKAQSGAVLGNETRLVNAKGRFVVARLKTWFDPNTIAKFRGNGPLTPSPRKIWLVDEQGRRFAPSTDGLAAAGGEGRALTDPLRPGESYETNVVFDVPTDARNLRLLITDPEPVMRVVIDSENSPLHGKIYLALPAAGAAQK